MQSLLKSLNMTEGDLAAMKKEIASNNPNSNSGPSPPTNASVQSPSNKETTSSQQAAVSSQSAGSVPSQNTPHNNGMMDLSSLELQLGLRSAPSTKETVQSSTKNSSQSSGSSAPQSSSTGSTATAANQGQISLQGPIPISLPNHL